MELGGAHWGRVQLLLCGVQFMGLGENAVAWGLRSRVGPLSPCPAVQGCLGRAVAVREPNTFGLGELDMARGALIISLQALEPGVLVPRAALASGQVGGEGLPPLRPLNQMRSAQMALGSAEF